MAKADPKDFLLNTEYEMDKIIYFTSGNTTPGQAKIIQHNLGFTPLIFGVCAFQEDFSDSKISPYLQWVANGVIDFQMMAGAEKITLNYRNDSSANQKLYYRIYAFEPSGYNTKIGKTSKYANQFILNTDYNYCKLYKKGYVDGNATITHNLGYIPLVMAWAGITNHFLNTATDYITVNNKEVKIVNSAPSGTPAARTNYRIYYDEA